MRGIFARIGALLLAVLLLSSTAAATPPSPVEPPKTATILFTHDVHSHLLPAPAEGGGEFGGFARLDRFGSIRPSSGLYCGRFIRRNDGSQVIW